VNPTKPAAVEPHLRRAAIATAVVFATSGALFASWVSRLPTIRDRLGAGEAELGLALLAPGVGALALMPLTGRLCQRVGSRRVVAASATLAAGLMAALALAPTTLVFGATLFVLGMGYGAWDVAMNVHGSAVERRAGRPWMPRYHACWSVGGLAGAGLGALLARGGVPVFAHFAVAAAATVALLFAALGHFLPDLPAAAARARSRGAGPRVLTPHLAAVGALTLCATMIEGAASDWLALFLTDVRGATASVAAAGYATFACAMAAGRFGGTAVSERLGRDGAVRAGALVVFAGIGLALLGPSLPTAFAGVALWGLGISLVFPAAISTSGETPGRPAEAIAAVSTIGYGGFLVGPPLLGLLAEQVGLARALLTLLVPAASVGVLASVLRPRPR
jgi:predicted MFS family arabinose efflux permease